MRIVDLSQRMEPHWAWDSTPLVSQSFAEGDEFQEFGLRWSGRGFTYQSAPGWTVPGAPSLDDLSPQTFAGVARVVDLTQAARYGNVPPGAFTDAIGSEPLPARLILRTGHSDAVPMRRREYFSAAPEIAPAVADMARERGVQHLLVDVPCDSLPSLRPDGTLSVPAKNEALRRRAHASGLVVTENVTGLLRAPEHVFLLAMPLSGAGNTSPTRPVALTQWASDNPIVYDVSTPFMNHWRWRFDIWDGAHHQNGAVKEKHFLCTGHGFTHCDAPRHMKRDGPTMMDLPNEGLDVYIGPSVIIDLSDICLPSPITKELAASRAGVIPKGARIILRTDLTNRLGYGSTAWHLRAPNLEVEAANWLLTQEPPALALDFPQDFVARQMPGRHVYNHEFVTHHAVFAQGVSFIEDLRDLGDISTRNPFLAAVPLKMTCEDGAPMRVFALEF